MITKTTTFVVLDGEIKLVMEQIMTVAMYIS